MANNRLKIMSKLSDSPIIKGTLILTAAGMIGKIISFVYRIMLTNYIGSEGLGLYQVVLPISGIVFSICCAGFQSAISRYTAKYPKDVQLWLISSLIPSIILSFAALFVTSFYSDIISERILLFKDAAPCVKMISWSFPFIALHDCCCGYFYGQKKTAIPALSQLIEQGIRIMALMACAICLSKTGSEIKPHHALIGNIISEAAAGLYTFLSVKHFRLTNNKTSHSLFYSIKKSVAFAFPLSVNSLMVHLFQSAEAVLIPAQLIVHGYSSAESLRIYGILSGMVLPLIMFPSVLTGSLSVLLMPSVARYNDTTKNTIYKTIKMCISLGIYSTLAYYTYISDIGSIIFNEPLVSDFIKLLAWLCPFMYLSSTMSSIINGAGKTTSTCIQNTLSIAIRLAALIFSVPEYGIRAYLYSLLLSKIFICIIQYRQIHRLFHIKTDIGAWIIKSSVSAMIAIGFSLTIWRTADFIMHTYDTALYSLITDTVMLCISAILFFIQLYILSRSIGAKRISGASS